MPRMLRKLLSWIRPRKASPPPTVVIIQRESGTFSVTEWRKLPDCIKRAQNVLANPDTKSMLDTLRNNHVGNYAVVGMPSLEVRAIIQAQGEGYAAAINDFQSLGVFQQETAELEESFLPETEQAATKK